MIALLQRVTQASVTVDRKIIGQIGKGLLILLCAERGDTEKEADQLLGKLLNYRVFSDENGKMNLSVTTTGGSMLIVPQFTLAADTRSGTRPSFSPAAPARHRQKTVRLFCGKSTWQTRSHPDRTIRCRHAGLPDKRRSRYVLAGYFRPQNTGIPSVKRL